MTALVLPDVDLYESWATTVAEFEPEQMHGSGWWHLQATARDTSPAGCRAWVESLRSYGDPDVELPDGLVPCDYYWITTGDPAEMVGFLALRHSLNEFLLEEGGHIGFSIRPSRRRRGHASRALALAVAKAGERGLERVLVTCDVDNRASAGTIEVNGGVFEDVRNGKRRYWITTRDAG